MYYYKLQAKKYLPRILLMVAIIASLAIWAYNINWLNNRDTVKGSSGEVLQGGINGQN